jgi:hypothetical protein
MSLSGSHGSSHGWQQHFSFSSHDSFGSGLADDDDPPEFKDAAFEDISDDDSEESESSSEDERVEEHVGRAGSDVPLVVKIKNMEDFASESDIASSDNDTTAGSSPRK